MKDAGGTVWQTLRLSEDDRNALTIARRLIQRAMREGCPEDVWRIGATAVDPRAVLINVDRIVDDWNDAAADES